MTNSIAEQLAGKASQLATAAEDLLIDMHGVQLNEWIPFGDDGPDPAEAKLAKVKRRLAMIHDLATDAVEEIKWLERDIRDDTRCGCDGEFGDEVVNVGRKVYGTCKTCRIYWWAGDNLFSGWRDELEELGEDAARELWARREAELKASYRKHVPATPAV